MEFGGPVESGDQITVCAAGSTCCRTYNSCQGGNPSFVCNAGKWCVIACGGQYGEYLCNGFYCYTCHKGCCLVPGVVTGSAISYLQHDRENGYQFNSNWCYNHTYQIAGGPGLTGHNRSFFNGCCMNQYAGTCYFGTFPGGGGATASAQSGNCYCSAPGSGGMVYLVFR
jgi:hypothetical protein